MGRDDPRRRLYPYQVEGVRLLDEKGRLILADEMGLGKTAQALSADFCLPLLVICPLSLLPTWSREARKWAPDITKVVEVVGTQKKRAKLWASREPGEKAIYIVSYESAKADEKMIRIWRGGVVIDEAHKLRNRTKTQLFLSLRRMTRLAGTMYLLTGTPVVNHPSEVWSYLHLLDRGRYRSFWRWVAQFFVLEEAGWGLDVGAFLSDTAREEYERQIHEFLLRRTKDEVGIQLPRRTEAMIPVRLTQQEWADYCSMYRSYMVTSESGRNTIAGTTLEQLTYLRLLAYGKGFLDGQDAPRTGSSKIRAAMDALSGCGGPAVTFSAFSRVAEAAAVDFRLDEWDTATLTGDTPLPQRRKLLEWFDEPAARGRRKLLCMTAEVGGLGLSLTSANVAVMLDKLWADALNRQSEDRIHRIGQLRPVTIYSTVAEGTVDEYIQQVIDEKLALIGSVNWAAKEVLRRAVDRMSSVPQKNE